MEDAIFFFHMYCYGRFNIQYNNNNPKTLEDVTFLHMDMHGLRDTFSLFTFLPLCICWFPLVYFGLEQSHSGLGDRTHSL